jgi:hypothetical protein
VKSQNFAHIYRFQEENIGQSMWDKMRCCWEHVVEHIGNLVNMLETHLELDGNTLGTKTISITPLLPPTPKCE